MSEGWIKVYYKMLDWEWMDDPYVVALWIRILLNTNQKEKKWHGETIKRGQWMTSIHNLSEQTGWSRNTIKRILRILEQSSQIQTETGTNGIIITVMNFGKYQNKGGSINNPPINQSRSTTDPLTDPLADPLTDPLADPLTDPNIRKKDNNIIIKQEPPIGGYNAPPREMGLEAYGILHNVMLNAQQRRTLAETFGQSETDTAIDELSCKLADGTFDSRNHYATLHYWLSYRINTGKAPAPNDHESELRQVWNAISEKDRQEYLDTHDGLTPWQYEKEHGTN